MSVNIAIDIVMLFYFGISIPSKPRASETIARLSSGLGHGLCPPLLGLHVHATAVAAQGSIGRPRDGPGTAL